MENSTFNVLLCNMSSPELNNINNSQSALTVPTLVVPREYEDISSFRTVAVDLLLLLQSFTSKDLCNNFLFPLFCFFLRFSSMTIFYATGEVIFRSSANASFIVETWFYCDPRIIKF